MCFRMKPWMPMITLIGKIKTSMSTIMTDFFRQSFQNYFHYCITIIGYYTRRWSETGPEYLEAIYYWLKASINQDRGKRERERERDLSTSKWYIWERLENVILFGFNCNNKNELKCLCSDIEYFFKKTNRWQSREICEEVSWYSCYQKCVSMARDTPRYHHNDRVDQSRKFLLYLFCLIYE